MKLQTFRQLARSDIHVDWIVDDLISSGSWTYFVGMPGVGKSMMLIQLCEALQSGKDFLGMKVKKRNCLYIQADSGVKEWKTQIENLAPDTLAWTIYEIEKGLIDEPKYVIGLHDIVWGKYKEGSREAKLLNYVPFDFVIFDSLNKLSYMDINTKSGQSTITKNLESICQQSVDENGETHRNEVHFILVHHPAKSQLKSRVYAGAGYQGFSSECGTVLSLGGNTLRLEKSKVASEKEIPLKRLANGAWALDIYDEHEDFNV